MRNKIFCITGKLGTFAQKKDAYTQIMQHGGVATDSLNKSCNYLVIGSKGNSNWTTAKKGGKLLKTESWIEEGIKIKIITEEDLHLLLENNEIVEGSAEWHNMKKSGKSWEIKSPKVIKEEFADFVLSTNLNSDSDIQGSYIFKIDYSIKCTYEEEEKYRAQIVAFNQEFLSLELPNLINISSKPALWEGLGDMVYVQLSKVFLVNPEEIDIHKKAHVILEEIKNNQSESKYKQRLSLRLWHTQSYYGYKWNEELKRRRIMKNK